MSGPKLFQPLKIANLDLRNRIVIAPMCQYSAVDGCMTDWHQIHLGGLALSGAGLLHIEASAVTPEGRISWGDVGLYDDATEAAMARTIESVRRWSDVPIAIQLAHAGRKASTEVPWMGKTQLPISDPHGWQTQAPSAIAFDDGQMVPTALSREQMIVIRDAFATAAVRAARIGLDAVQLHAAHGYLLHQFLSPLSNLRTDDYGGSLENRMRYPLEIFDAIRATFPADRAISVRVSATDWMENGWDVEQTIAFAQALEARGCDAIDVSSGGLHVQQQIALSPGYQVPFARAIRAACKMRVMTVGLITDYDHAEAIVATGDADMVSLARGILYDPRWPWHAAAHLGATVKAPPQYHRSQPSRYRNLLEA